MRSLTEWIEQALEWLGAIALIAFIVYVLAHS